VVCLDVVEELAVGEGVVEVVPFGASEFSGHSEHVLAAASENLAVGHVVQSVLLLVAEYVPAEHARQGLESVGEPFVPS
jgi:hypothetical protein